MNNKKKGISKLNEAFDNGKIHHEVQTKVFTDHANVLEVENTEPVNVIFSIKNISQEQLHNMTLKAFVYQVF